MSRPLTDAILPPDQRQIKRAPGWRRRTQRCAERRAGVGQDAPRSVGAHTITILDLALREQVHIGKLPRFTDELVWTIGAAAPVDAIADDRLSPNRQPVQAQVAVEDGVLAQRSKQGALGLPNCATARSLAVLTLSPLVITSA